MTHSGSQIIKKLLLDRGFVTEPEAGQAWPAFVGNLPDSPDVAVLINDTTGVKNGRLMRGPVIFKPGVQIIVRAFTYVDGRAKLEQIEEYIDTVLRQAVTIEASAYTLHSIRRPSSIISMGTEPGTTKRRELFSLNLLLTVNQNQ